MSTIALKDLAEAVWDDIVTNDPLSDFENLVIGENDLADNSVHDKLAIVFDDIEAAVNADDPTSVTVNTSAAYECYYDFTTSAGAPVFRVSLSVVGAGVNKLFGEVDAIGSVTINSVTLGVTDHLNQDASGTFAFAAGTAGVVIDFESGLQKGPTLFDGEFSSFSFTSDYLSLSAAGSIQFDIDPDGGEVAVVGSLDQFEIIVFSPDNSAEQRYRLAIEGDIHFSQFADGRILLDGSKFSSFSLEEAGNHARYIGDFTWYGDVDTGHVAGSVSMISMAFAGASFDFGGAVTIDPDGQLSGTITTLRLHAEGFDEDGDLYDATYSFENKSVNVLDLFDADGDMMDIDGNGEVDKYDLYYFLVDHIDGATLTGVKPPTIGLENLAEAVWDDIAGIDPWPDFKDLVIGESGSDELSVLDKLAIVFDDIIAAADADDPSGITVNTSAAYECFYDFTTAAGAPAFRVSLAVAGTGVNKLFGEEDAIGSVTINSVTLAVTDHLDQEASGTFAFTAGAAGVVIDFDSGLQEGPTLFDGVFSSFTFTSDYLTLRAEGSIQFNIDPEGGDVAVVGSLDQFEFAVLSPDNSEEQLYRLAISGAIDFRHNSDGSISLDGSEFSSFSVEASGNHIEYTGDFTWHGDVETGHVAGSVYTISVALADASFDFGGDIHVDDQGLLSGTITNLQLHAEGIAGDGSVFDAIYSFENKSVNVLDLFDADGEIKDIDGDGDTDEHDLFEFLVDHIDGATLTGVNLPPEARDDSVATNNYTTLTVDAEHGLLANDTDFEGDDLEIIAVNGWSGNVGTSYSLGYTWIPVPPYFVYSVGTISINADGSYMFVPGPALAYLTSGQTVTFNTGYTVSDGNGNTADAMLAITVTGTAPNHAPTVYGPISTALNEGAASYSLYLLSNVYDQDGDALSVTGVTWDGSITVPAGMSLSGTMLTVDPQNAAFNSLGVGQSRTINVSYTVTDGHGGTASQSASITINGTNDAPTVANQIADQNATEDAVFSFTVLSNTFADADTGDTLSYSAILADGSVLPTWLSFNSVTRTFSGTPLNGNVGTVNVKVTATDGGGLRASDEFTLTVANVNDAPMVANPIANQSATEGSLFSFIVPSNTFADIDAGDSLAWSATLANGSPLPSWLSFNSTTHTFSGTATNDNVGVITVKVTATDGSSTSASDEFTLTVTNTNNAPTVANAIADQSATEDNAFSFIVPTNTFADVDAGDSLNWSATLSDGGTLPSWLSFDSVTHSFSGTPLNSDTGAITVKVTATDSGNSSASDVFSLTVANVNDAPTVAAPLESTPVTEGDTSFTIDLLDGATDAESDTLSVSAVTYDGLVRVPAGLTRIGKMLTVNPQSSGFDSLGDGQTRTIHVAYSITDGHGGTVSQTATITVNGVDDAPTSTNDSITIPDNAPKVLKLTDFGFYDDPEGDDFSTVTITSVPAVGTLEYSSNGVDWSEITSETEIPASEITSGHLKYVPADGMNSTAIGFHVTGGGLPSADYVLTVYAEHVETLGEGENAVGDSTVNVPAGVVAESRTVDADTVGDQLAALVDSSDNPAIVQNQELIHQQIDEYVLANPDAGNVHELRLTADEGFTGTVVIDADESGDDVMVIDASQLPHGTVIDLNNIGFAVIIGPGYYNGGAGSNIIVADGGSQFIILGLDDDTTHGGAGNDTIGSTFGNDDLYGDEDQDLVFGGAGNDSLHGGTGDDTIAGGNVTVHADGSHTVTDDVGNDVMDGGEGTDVIEFSGAYADYHFSYDKATESWTVQSALQASAEGDSNIDTITGSEVFSFTDGNHNAVAHDCTVDVTYWKSGAGIEGVQTTITDTGNDQERTGLTDENGESDYTGLIQGEYELDTLKNVDDNEIGSIDSLDVLYTLKLALGVNPNSSGTEISSYQYLAANAYADGQIDSLDVLNVLKIALEINTPQWILVRDGVGLENMDENNVHLPDTIMSFSLENNARIDLVGVLVGDVDGTMSF